MMASSWQKSQTFFKYTYRDLLIENFEEKQELLPVELIKVLIQLPF